jgi:hypothetical protein
MRYRQLRWIETRLSVANRVAFWQRVHERLAKLHIRTQDSNGHAGEARGPRSAVEPPDLHRDWCRGRVEALDAVAGAWPRWRSAACGGATRPVEAPGRDLPASRPDLHRGRCR